MIAFLTSPVWGFALFLFKPQVGSMAGLRWFAQAENRWKLLLPSVILVTLSFVIWGFWPQKLFANATAWGGDRSVGPWNVAPWPWLIPVGIWLLYLGWKRNDDLFAVMATICLTPYFALYSFTLFVAMLAARKPYQALIASVILWSFAMFMRWYALNIYT